MLGNLTGATVKISVRRVNHFLGVPVRDQENPGASLRHPRNPRRNVRTERWSPPDPGGSSPIVNPTRCPCAFKAQAPAERSRAAASAAPIVAVMPFMFSLQPHGAL